jgi:hypothetical protein
MNNRLKKSEAAGHMSLAVVALLLSFLASSAPHRVHHLFEQVPISASRDAEHSHDVDHSADGHHTHRDHNSPHSDSRPNQSDCLVQSVAYNSHLSQIQQLDILFLEIVIEGHPVRRIVSLSHYNLSPLSQRAPPSA